MSTSRDLSKYTYFRGRVGLYAILKALNIHKDDEIAIQAFTCLAVPEAILAIGAKPLYIDIKPRQFNMSVSDLAYKITSQTKAVVVQHTYGIPANMDEIVKIAGKFNIPIIEDCCHTLSGSLHGKMLGTFGAASFYSFEWGKPLVVGLGGSVTLNDQNLQEKLEAEYKQLRNPSISTQVKIHLQYLAFQLTYSPRHYWIVKDIFKKLSTSGIAKSNYNHISRNVSNDFYWKMIPSLKKRLIIKQKNISKIAEQSNFVSHNYRNKINSCSIQHPLENKDSKIYYARYPLLVENKEELLNKARFAKIEISDWYNTPIHPLREESLEKVYYQVGSCPNVEAVCRKVITLPTHLRVTGEDLRRTIEFFKFVN